MNATILGLQAQGFLIRFLLYVVSGCGSIGSRCSGNVLLAKAPRLAQAGSILMSTIKQIDGNYSEKPCDHPKLKDLHDVQPHPPPLWITLRILRSCLLRGRTDNAGPGWSEFHEPYILCVFPKALSQYGLGV